MNETEIRAIVKNSNNRSSYNDDRGELGCSGTVISSNITNNTTGVVTTYSTTSTTSKKGKEVVRDYKKTEENILSGDATVLPNPMYNAKSTMKLQGLGCLNGLYYVEKVTHTFSNSGYSQVLSLSKSGVGDSIKSGMVVVETPPPVTNIIIAPYPVVTPPQPIERTHTVVSGDTLWGLARSYYDDGSKYMTIFNANTSILSDPNLIIDGQVLIIP